MDWRQVRVSAADAANLRHVALQNEFEQRFIKLQAPPDMALFAGDWTRDRASSGTRDDYYLIYFSPASANHSADIVAKYGGSPCGKPARAGLSLLVGDQLTAWNLV